MMRAFGFLVAVALAVGLGAPAHADAKVEPKPKDARLVLEAGRHSPGKQSPPTQGGNIKTTDPKPADAYCQLDAGNEVQCYPETFEQPADEDEAELTEGDVVRAVRELGLPSLTVQIQPGEETLVNIETIFYTNPQPFERSITLLGFDVDVVASPVRYTWVHDDGTVSTSSKPGRPYPAMDVTHRYRKPADDVNPRVDVTYRVRYRVDGGAWQTIGQTLQASGPSAELDVREAAPVLTRP
ncbi:hypothetical protein [Aeromicrobium sp. NPDC092404]|uniref:hypothetical protein n=1 Tax=Aeromicrobium sp. NPDC092404 TaxID=3154976 RepID=UPI0034428DE9